MSTTPAPATKKKKQKKDPRDYTLDDAKQDFRIFLLAIWVHLGLPAPTPIQYDIARFIQLGPKRMIVMAFRGVGKSWITSAFVCWLLLNNPQLKILVVSASKERSDAFSIFTKRLINEVPMLQHLRAGEDQRDSNIAFDVGPATAAHAPSVKSIGITGQLTGSRADVIQRTAQPRSRGISSRSWSRSLMRSSHPGAVSFTLAPHRLRCPCTTASPSGATW